MQDTDKFSAIQITVCLIYDRNNNHQGFESDHTKLQNTWSYQWDCLMPLCASSYGTNNHFSVDSGCINSAGTKSFKKTSHLSHFALLQGKVLALSDPWEHDSAVA